MKSRRAGRAMWMALVVLLVPALVLVLLLLVLGVLLALSPGTPKPFFDDSGQPLAGSISEKARVDTNGVEQGMFIQGRSAGNPVLLYLHGGLPDRFLNDGCPRAVAVAGVTHAVEPPSGALHFAGRAGARPGHGSAAGRAS